MTLLRALVACMIAGALLGAPRVLGAQDAPMTPKEFHDRIVALLKEIAARPLPSGDTSVTWRRTPILYHTVARSDTLVRSGFVRNDGVTGLASVVWRGSTPTKFDVLWIQGDSTLTSLSGAVDGSTLNVAGSRKGSFTLPSIPWAIGDYGMDEQLVILLQHLPVDSNQRIAVFRPFGFKWDTVSVRVTRGPEGTLRVAEPESTDTTRWVISNTGDLLQLTRDTTIVERRPLEETRLYRLYRRVRITPPDFR